MKAGRGPFVTQPSYSSLPLAPSEFPDRGIDYG